MKIGYIGNFDPAWSTENDLRLGLEALGHKVVPLQENRLSSKNLAWAASEIDLLLWTSTWDTAISPDIAADFMHALAVRQVPSIAYHLDTFWTTNRRGRAWWRNPMWRCQVVATADGDPHPWAEMGVNHVWMPPGVRHTVEPGTPRAEWVCDVAFVGADGQHTPYHPEWTYRPELIAALRSMCAANGWSFRNPGGSDPKIDREHMADFYASARVTVGDSLCPNRERSIYWSDRVYEATGRAGLLVMPKIRRLQAADQFAGQLPQYEWGDWDGLERTIARYLQDTTLRTETRKATWNLTSKRHTYRHRAQSLISLVK